ncbi:hypothetical protein CLV97_101286 [Planifilum fimeticola]|jgi:hypothetical protein|uniref:Uncharacterized protein n=1 Tax=Planifilum fimeticola TaxID=201975 RepID=A0A2T0LJW0_9BACL|nr:hypothetical protein CLV97_101286 [Planifilum fimeticola]
MAEIERCLMFTFWGSYVKEDYLEVSLDVVGILMKYLEACQLEGRKNTVLENIDSLDSIRKEVLSDRERYRYYKITFFNPSVTEEVYVNRLFVSAKYMLLEEYEGLRFFQTEDVKLNEQRSQKLLDVFTDVAGHPALEELWMIDDRRAFMGKPAYLYRPESLYDRVEEGLYTLDAKEEVIRLVEEFESHVPREWVIDYLQDRLGAESVQEMEDGKIRVLFYDRELTKNKVGNTRKFLRTFERHVDEYLLQKGIRLYKGDRS